MWRAVESVSWRVCYLLTGQRKSLCAMAWDRRDKPLARLHIAIWDRVFALAGDHHHCARVSRYWRNIDRRTDGRS